MNEWEKTFEIIKIHIKRQGFRIEQRVTKKERKKNIDRNRRQRQRLMMMMMMMTPHSDGKKYIFFHLQFKKKNILIKRRKWEQERESIRLIQFVRQLIFIINPESPERKNGEKEKGRRKCHSFIQ